ncbi:hypothetical protein KCTC32516_01332 [Polaribacter huanghezhanensis]|uniref:ImmA/IrrE family metallo-endopeptidase n=1 Tax=Polaribacter huanghezhanensis TaxID=1354726 RepID=UPI00264983DE|nr:ImmA/IrrE family metallo-endopeptidase [Polaribacter huanghezhanensis]WKD85982.1 hypothetical protein KCTC32516_01332 [Polaribacter huanghezhanensis]
MAEKAYITPQVLKWARESARVDLSVAALHVKTSEERLISWEDGINFPTIVQAKKLAKFYKRPFALFFLPKPPRDFQPLQDFRKSGSKSISTGSIFIIREIQEKQSWISELYKENEEEKVPFVGKFSINDNPVEVAKDILTTLNINPLNYKSKNPILEWVKKAESKGIFISRTSFIHSNLKLDKYEIQGFAISDEYAPFVFVNSDDWNAPQLFTLVHELAHIWISETGLSNQMSTVVRDKDKYHPVELFCNEVTANALMPDKLFEGVDQSNFTTHEEIYNISKFLGVSSLAFLVRAYNLNLISTVNYNRLKAEADSKFKDFLTKEAEKKAKLKEEQKRSKKPNGPNYFLLQLNRNSRLFTQTVLDAFKGGNIQSTQASSLLNVKVNKFPKLEAQLYK